MHPEETEEPEQYDVVVAGGGPVGLMLACELRLAGVRPLVLDRLTEPSGQDRAGVLHIRTVETLDLRGLLDRFLEGTEPCAGLPFAGMFKEPLRFGDLDAHHPYSLLIPQSRTEYLLTQRAAELGAEVRRGHEVVALDQDADAVTVHVRGPAGRYTVRAGYLAGCDGSRSTVRALAGIPFTGTDPSVSALIGYVHSPEKNVPRRWQRTATGQIVLAFPPDGGIGRVVTVEYGRLDADHNRTPTLDELRAAVTRVLGREMELTEPVQWLSRFTDASRQAETYRRGRVLLAGDAAHIHFPIGGQGLNSGLQDAVNLGWKLAARVQGWGSDDLLDSYHAERHPVSARILLNTRAQLALMNPDQRHVTPLRTVFEELMTLPAVNRFLTEMITGLGIRYHLGPPAAAAAGPALGTAPSGPAHPWERAGGPAQDADTHHPLVGRFLPALRLKTADRTIASARLLWPGRSVLVDLADQPALAVAAAPWSARLDSVTAGPERSVGADAFLVRPDGYVAWAQPEGAAPDLTALRQALTRWCGAPA